MIKNKILIGISLFAFAGCMNPTVSTVPDGTDTGAGTTNGSGITTGATATIITDQYLMPYTNANGVVVNPYYGSNGILVDGNPVLMTPGMTITNPDTNIVIPNTTSPSTTVNDNVSTFITPVPLATAPSISTGSTTTTTTNGTTTTGSTNGSTTTNNNTTSSSSPSPAVSQNTANSAIISQSTPLPQSTFAPVF